MPFESARAHLDTSDREHLDSLLDQWASAGGVAAQAAENLHAEHGCTTEILTNYLRALAAARASLAIAPPGPGPAPAFKAIGSPFVLAGYVATPWTGLVFGRAILLEKYARYLSRTLDGNLSSLKCVDDAETVRETLRALQDVNEADTPRAYAVYFKAMRLTSLGKDAVFATFAKLVASSESPWPDPRPGADKVRNSLALGADPPGKDYILFAYRLPTDTLPKVPTTASPGWTYQQWYRPNAAAAAELHGWTAPPDSRDHPCPEIVHSEIDGNSLVFPIHLALA